MDFQMQGISVKDVAKEYGTPFYWYDSEVLKTTYNDLKTYMPEEIELFYSLKANPNITIYNYLKSLGAKAEVSSLAELKTVLLSGTNPADIIFLGPGKSEEEIKCCIENSIYAIVCESIQELQLINDISIEFNKKTSVALRINPSFITKGSKLTMGGKPRQFGIDEEFILSDSNSFKGLSNIDIIGIHVYMGTRILEHSEIYQNTVNILQLSQLISSKLGFNLQFVDIGGGLGVPYFEKEKELDLPKLGETLHTVIKEFKNKFPYTRIFMELGRYLVAKSGIFVSKVRYLKESRGELFAITDGGTNCHMAAVGISSFVKRNFPMKNLCNLDGVDKHLYNVAGPLCTPNDLVGKLVELPTVSVGDFIGVFNSGAYGPSASPVLFLSHGYPAEILMHNSKSYLIRNRDNANDILGKQTLYDLVPEKV
ncbi:type III PLP-dependent enzyme [Bacillus sp. RO2]|uniref:type III PLP-dependent enzyme n=1 Tax=Bacillus sp. RO2 TaxID=2723913 RepID=UPI00145FAF09|nr:type III PLP-dependent enzyme [Bacillus sp. RO2]NMH73539.1 type III PLP-dependent enzyme [Bacillus sp. RO2]